MAWTIPSIRFGKKTIPEEVFKQLEDIIQPGMCILVRDPLKLSHILIGGHWSHAAICVRKLYVNDVWQMKIIGEMGHSNYQELDLKEMLGYSQSVCVIKPKLSTPEYLNSMAARAQILGHVSRQYDQLFELGEESLYCSELVYMADDVHLYDASLEDLAGLGKPYISPDGLYKSNNSEVVFEWHT